MSVGHKPVYQRIEETYLLHEKSGLHVTAIRSDKIVVKALNMFRDNQLQKYQTVTNTDIANTKERVSHGR